MLAEGIRRSPVAVARMIIASPFKRQIHNLARSTIIMYDPKRDVLSLLTSTYSGSKDEYGGNVVPTLPLSFDRVNEGRPPSSNSILFKLPIELLSPIIQSLPKESLASFALVNRDCRQLARSRQFASVHLDYSDKSWLLLNQLIKEAGQREKHGSTMKPSLGACIRRLTVATNPECITRLHQISLGEDFSSLDEQVQSERLAKAAETYFDGYLLIVQAVLTRALPHLELLDWEDMIVTSRSFFNSLVLSPVKHLKLFRVQVDDEYEIELPESLSSTGWPLRTLHLELNWVILGRRSEGSPMRLCSSILRACAPTLESLVWIGDHEFPKGPTNDHLPRESTMTGTPPQRPYFPRLMDLRLRHITFPPSLTLEDMLSPQRMCSIRAIDLNPEADPSAAKFFESQGVIPSLETFVWSTYRLIPATHSLNFLRENSQLLKLSIPNTQPPLLLRKQLLPLLSKSFTRLQSLELKWEAKLIPESAIELIGTLHSLEQIHLSAGEQFGWAHDWLIDHNAMCEHLAPLQGLKKLAFSRDTYPAACDFIEPNEYYHHRALSSSVLGVEQLQTGREKGTNVEQLWEKLHRKLILAKANEYLRIFPKLEWLYFGQIPMGVGSPDYGDEGLTSRQKRKQRRWGKGCRLAVALSDERDNCWTVLQRIFGREGWEE